MGRKEIKIAETEMPGLMASFVESTLLTANMALIRLMVIRTSPFRKNDKQHSAYRTIPLHSQSSNSAYLTEMACAIVRHLYRPSYKYAKAGVMLMDLHSADTKQLSLQLGSEELETRTRLMQAQDSINSKWGRGTLHLASA